MRFLADMGVSQRVVAWLRNNAHDVVHLRDQKLERLDDLSIFQKAVSERRIILTFDLDFGEIVALSRGATISVILFRLKDSTSVFVIARLAAVLREARDALDKGAIVVVEDARHRVRRLPLGA
ncbi:MAG: DUF5615 family PIN-like protein [Tepidisphaeraceae bacterium]